MADLGYFEHKTMDGDRWDLLAYRYYGDQYKQGIIIEANRSLFLTPPSHPSDASPEPPPDSPTIVIPPLILSAGLTLKIPVIAGDDEPANDLPPWKRAEPEYGDEK